MIPILDNLNLKSTHFINSDPQRLSYSGYLNE